MVEIGIGDNCPDFDKPASEWTDDELKWVRLVGMTKVPEAEEAIIETKKKLNQETDKEKINTLQNELSEWEERLKFAQEMRSKALVETSRRGIEKGFGFLF